jgi:3-oxoadipate enol-lactonase
MPPNGQLIDGPECRLYVETIGEGAPVTIFAHGVTSSVEELRPFARYVPGTRVLFDLRGHGRSDARANLAYDNAAMTRDLLFLADEFGATQAWGTSMGAGALMAALGAQPDRFARVAFFIPACIDEMNAAAIELFPREAALLERFPVEELAERAMTSDAYAPLFAARPYWRDLVRKRFLRMNSTGVPATLRAFVNGGPPLSDRTVLRAVRAPALVLSHEGDPIHPASVARELAAALGNGAARIWPETLAMYDDIDATAREVGEFFSAS